MTHSGATHDFHGSFQHHGFHHDFDHHPHHFIGFAGFYYPYYRSYYPSLNCRDYCNPNSRYYDPDYCYRYCPRSYWPAANPSSYGYNAGPAVVSQSAVVPKVINVSRQSEPSEPTRIPDGVPVRAPLLSSPEAPEALPPGS